MSTFFFALAQAASHIVFLIPVAKAQLATVYNDLGTYTSTTLTYIGPLTTTWTAPNHCFTATRVTRRTSTWGVGLTRYDEFVTYHLGCGSGEYTSCCPPGWNPYGYYAPGVLPAAHRNTIERHLTITAGSIQAMVACPSLLSPQYLFYRTTTWHNLEGPHEGAGEDPTPTLQCVYTSTNWDTHRLTTYFSAVAVLAQPIVYFTTAIKDLPPGQITSNPTSSADGISHRPTSDLVPVHEGGGDDSAAHSLTTPLVSATIFGVLIFIVVTAVRNRNKIVGSFSFVGLLSFRKSRPGRQRQGNSFQEDDSPEDPAPAQDPYSDDESRTLGTSGRFSDVEQGNSLEEQIRLSTLPASTSNYKPKLSEIPNRSHDVEQPDLLGEVVSKNQIMGPTSHASTSNNISQSLQGRFYDHRGAHNDGDYVSYQNDTRVKSFYELLEEMENVPTINILLIGTGVCIKNQNLKDLSKSGRLRAFRSYLPRNEQNKDDNNSLIDSHGHETATAGLLAYYTKKNVFIYSARVVKEDNPTIKSADVAQAINDAIDKKYEPIDFHVIVMPFGFQGRDENLREAIDNAKSSNILLIAAAGNNGELSGNIYPASDPKVLSAYSSKGNGVRSTFSPEGYITVPGENVLVEVPDAKLGDPSIPGRNQSWKSGTSFAAPILAGICASILQLSGNEAKNRNANWIRSVLKSDFMALETQNAPGGYFVCFNNFEEKFNSSHTAPDWFTQEAKNTAYQIGNNI